MEVLRAIHMKPAFFGKKMQTNSSRDNRGWSIPIESGKVSRPDLLESERCISLR